MLPSCAPSSKRTAGPFLRTLSYVTFHLDMDFYPLMSCYSKLTIYGVNRFSWVLWTVLLNNHIWGGNHGDLWLIATLSGAWVTTWACNWCGSGGQSCGLSPLTVKSDSIEREVVPELSWIVISPAGVWKLLAVWGSLPTHIETGSGNPFSLWVENTTFTFLFTLAHWEYRTVRKFL